MRLMPLTALVSFMITGGLLAGCAAPITGGLVAGIVPSGENYSNESTSTKLSQMADAANTTLTTDQQLKMPQEVLGYDQQLIDMVGKEQGIYAKQGTTPTPAWSAQIQTVLAARSQFIQNYYNKNIAPHEFVIRPMKGPQWEQQDPAWQAPDNSPTQAEQYEQMSH